MDQVSKLNTLTVRRAVAEEDVTDVPTHAMAPIVLRVNANVSSYLMFEAS